MNTATRTPAGRVVLAIGVLLLALFTSIAANPGRAQASTASCPAGWQLHHFNYEQNNSVPLVHMTASVNFYYCTGVAGQPTMKQFPGGHPVVQHTIGAVSYNPVSSLWVSNVRSEPVGIVAGRCDVPGHPGLNTHCYRLLLRTTADVDQKDCLFFRSSVSCFTMIRDRFVSTVTVDVSAGHGAWMEKAKLGPA